MEFSFTIEIKNVVTVESDSERTIPIRTKVMGEDHAWDFHLSVGSFTAGHTCCPFRLESKVNPMKTISYTLEYDDPLGPKKSYLLSEMNYLSLPYKGVVGLKIQLERGEALQQIVTVRRLYNDESTADVELHCGTLVIRAHKAMLGLHSETLRVAFGNLGCVEGQTGVYRIAEQHMKPEILEDVVKWMYVHSIENPQDKMPDLLEAAEYLQINGLKETCGRQLSDRVSAKECLQAVLWNRNYFLRFRFRFRLLKSNGSGSGSDF